MAFRQGGFSGDRGFRRRFDEDSDGDRPRRSFGGGGRRFGGGGFRGGGRSFDRKPVEMHDVICDKCKKECQVPFKPTEGKEVLCSECFEKSGNQRTPGRTSGISKEQFDSLNAKIDKIMTALKIE